MSASLTLTRFDDVHSFSDRVASYLMLHETEHNVLLGIISQLIVGGIYTEPPYLVVVEDFTGIKAVAMRTPPHGLLLSRVSDADALFLVAQDVHDVYQSIPFINGNESDVKIFAGHWQALSGQASDSDIAMGVYETPRITMPDNMPGVIRPADTSDVDLVAAWIQAFEAEIFQTELTEEQAKRGAHNRIPSTPERGFRLLEVDGKVITMCGYTGPTPNGIRINAVYTPPEYRRRGYASACVAQTSQELLDSGHKFCFLFTDLDNPTSNHIYQTIGYQHVCDSVRYLFHDA